MTTKIVPPRALTPQKEIERIKRRVEILENRKGGVGTGTPPTLTTQVWVCNITSLDIGGHVLPPVIASVEPPMFPTFGGTLLGARLWTRDDVLPTSTVTVDVLKNGTSIFTTLPTIPSGQAFGSAVVLSVPFVADDKLQPSVIAPGGATIICLVLDYRRT